MITKYGRIQIAAINSPKAINKARYNNAVPEKDTFNYVFKNALNGNELAAVLLDEWQKNCCPRDEKEKQVVQLIKKATDKIFI